MLPIGSVGKVVGIFDPRSEIRSREYKYPIGKNIPIGILAISLINPRQLKRIRQELGMTQVRLAQSSGLSQSLIAKIEAGTVDPTFTSLSAISEALRSRGTTKGKTAADVMSSPVISVQTSSRLSDCVAMMKRHGISQMPVVAGETPVGSVTENHILGLLSDREDVGTLLTQQVRKFMRPPFPTVSGDTPIEALFSLFGYVPAVLVSSGERLEGIIAKIDVLVAQAGRF
jgi:predicted transcriptional regulator